MNSNKIGVYRKFKPFGSMIGLAELQDAIVTGTYEDVDLEIKVNALRATTSDEERSQIKKSLPAVSLAGDFGNDRTADHTLEDYTGLIQVDIDGVEDPIAIKRKVSTDPYVLLCFISQSGNGVKVVVRVDCDQSHHKEASEQYYNHLNRLINEN